MRVLRNRWLLLSLMSAGCAIWLVGAFPRLHPAIRLGLQFDREEYIDQARRFAAKHGVDVAGWRGSVQTSTLGKNQELRLMMPRDESAATFPGAEINVTLLPARGGTSASVKLRPDGHPLGWKLPMAARTKREPAEQQSNVIQEMAGNDSTNYSMTSAANSGNQGTEFKWQRMEHGSGTPHISIDVAVRNGVAWKAGTVFSFPESAAKRLDSFPAARTTISVFWFLILFAGIAISVLREGGARTARAGKDPSVLYLTGVVAAAAAVASLLDWDNAENFSTAFLGVVLGAMLLGLPFYTMFAATVLNAGLHPAHVRGIRLLGTRAIFSRAVNAELLGGWLAAPILAALPLTVSALMRVPAFRGYDDGFLLSHSPLLATVLNLADQGTIATLGLFGVMIPLALRFIRRTPVRLPVMVLFSLVTFAMLNAPYRDAQPANFTWAALQACLSLWIYFRFGVLGAMSAWCSARILNAAGALIVQPAAGLHSSGLLILAALGAFGILLFAVTWKGADLVAELSGESGAHMARSRREELQAEFNVARSAQQQMLPASPPVLEGYTLAASCVPAREVGGDLYDFLRLSEGRWGIGVADVSGKGVTAALYMTLTKGLLAAAAQDTDDPRQILGSVNKHLRTVTKKKMFVTMALGVLDPATGTMEYARAGHNPVVWRRTSAGETRLLSGAGIGLGIAGPALFAKTLQTESIVLAPGDALVFYSDGLTEAMDQDLEQFGEERLMAAVERADGLQAGLTHDSILKEVRHFLKGGNSQDDLTIAVLRVNI